MKNNCLTIIAPGHNELDQRVNRVVELAATRFNKVNILYEKRLSQFEKINWPVNVSCYYVENTYPRFKVFPKISNFIEAIYHNKIESKNFYIHDSGIVGLLMAKALRDECGIKAKIIFDYHDHIKWEIHYQISKIFPGLLLNKIIGSAFFRVVRLYLRLRYSRILDGIVGISDSQINELLEWIKPDKQIACISIPNTRQLLNISNEKLDGEFLDAVDFLWIGNIVDGRDLPETICCLDELQKTQRFNLYIFGNIISKKIFDEICKREYVIYMGPFKSDQDMLELVNEKRLIGLFFGWNDLWGTGINKISSPNKIFSYINIGVPVIIHSKVNPTAFNIDARLGETFESIEDFFNCFQSISKEYSRYKKTVNKCRGDYLWEHDLNKRIIHLIDKVYI